MKKLLVAVGVLAFGIAAHAASHNWQTARQDALIAEVAFPRRACRGIADYGIAGDT